MAITPTTQGIVEAASTHLEKLSGHVFDLLTVEKPISPEAAVNLSKIVSKLSPILGNLIEFNVVEYLNGLSEYQELGEWKRQDPGFPDAIFAGSIQPIPGFEIKAWFPLATEITARFKDSQLHFTDDNTYVCLIAWMPDRVIYGKPRIVDVCIISGKEIAKSRDDHYHNPPDYLVLEPRDTTQRTRNLQQTNTNGYKLQDPTTQQLHEAENLIASWGSDSKSYSPSAEYQDKLQSLFGSFTYRLDTNYAKIDRIQNSDIESFKQKVAQTMFEGKTVSEWVRVLRSTDEDYLRTVLSEQLDITEEPAETLLE